MTLVGTAQAPQARLLQRNILVDALAAQAFEAAPAAMVLVDRSHQVIAANACWRRMFGFERDDVTGRPGADLTPGAAPAVAPLIDRVFDTGQGIGEVEFQAPARPGAPPRHWSCSFTPVHGPDGEVSAVMSVTRDVTERRAREAEVRRSEEELDSLYRAAPVGLCAFDRDLRFVRVNETMAAVNGVDAAGHLGKTLVELQRDARGRAVAGAVEDKLREVIRTGRTIRQEVHDGQRWLRATWSPMIGPDGAVSGVNTVVEDISEIKRSEALARERLDELDATYKTAPIGLCVLDRELRFVRINEHLAEINGVPAAAHAGRTIWDIVPQIADEIAPVFRNILDTGEPVLNYELRGETKAQPGVQRIWLEHFYPLHDSAGGIAGVNVVCEEITARKRAEEHRELLMRELDHRVKNILAVVQSVAALTLRFAKSPEHFHEAFGNRIAALARAHDMLTKGQWLNADMEGLIRQTLAPYRGADKQIALGGPALRLTPAAALSLAMVLHELATNAAKYGALSTDAGRLDLHWQCDGAAVVIDWREAGGPPVAAPGRRGFGSLLVERSVAHEMKGETRLDYAPSGLCAAIRFPQAGNIA